MELQECIQEFNTYVVYESAFGEEFKCDVIELSEIEGENCKPIKINLAGSFGNYLNGAGECIEAVTNDYGYLTANSDTRRGYIFFARLLRDSKYYDSLKKGMYVLVESRGTEGRPVANYYELRIKYGESNWD